MKSANRISQLGRSAALVQALAVAFCATGVGFYFTLGATSPDGMTSGAILGIVCPVVLIVWSVVLGIRAVWAGERLTWPLVVLTLTLWEVSLVVLGLWAWYMMDSILRTHYPLILWANYNALPVLLPAGLLAITVAVPFALWRVRVGRRRRAASGALALSRAEEIGRVLPWTVAVVAIVEALLLPLPLFVFCVVFGLSTSSNFKVPWCRLVVEYTPNAMRDPVEAISRRGWLWPDGISATLIESGYVSTARLKERIYGGSDSAWVALEQLDQIEAIRFARAVAAGKVDASTISTAVLIGMGQLLVYGSSVEELRTLLRSDAASPPSVPFRRGMLEGLRRSQREQKLLPEIETYIEQDEYRDYALNAWQSIIAANRKRPEVSASAARLRALQLKVLSGSDANTKRAVLEFLCNFASDFKEPALVRAVLDLTRDVNGNDKRIRELAASVLARMFIDQAAQRAQEENARATAARAARDAAEAWLAQQKTE